MHNGIFDKTKFNDNETQGASTVKHIVSFSDLRLLMTSTMISNHISYLSNPGLQEKLQKMHWNAFKYAALLAICVETIPADQADAALSQLPGFKDVSESVRQTALVRIIHTQRHIEYRSYNRPFTFSIFAHACQLYSQDIATKDNPDSFFTHADDFFDHVYLITALNEIPLSHWPKIFELPGMESHVPFLLQGYFQYCDIGPLKPDSPNVLESLKIFKDEEKIKAFLARPNVLESILNGLSDEERAEAIASNDYIKHAVDERRKSTNNTPGDIMITHSSFNTIISGGDALSCMQRDIMENNCSLNNLEDVIIRTLTSKFKYHELINEDTDIFQQLLTLLRADAPEKRIPALNAPDNQEMLMRIQWSSYKYAQILDICCSDELSLQEAHAKLSFSAIPAFIKQEAHFGIVKRNNKDAYGLALLDFACKQFEEDMNEFDGFSPVFNDGSDFPDQDTFLHVLNTVSVQHWHALFSLKDINRHLVFSFEDCEDAEDLLDIFDETRCIHFLMWPGVMASFMEALKDDDLVSLIQSNAVFRGCFQEHLEQVKSDKLARPYVLEGILESAAHEDRWNAIASIEPIKNAFIKRIGQGCGDKVLELLGDAPNANNDDDLAITRAVYEAAKTGFEQLNETKGLSSAQYRQFHFFSPQKTHPFLSKLEKNLEARKAQPGSSTRLK